jgi:tetrahydromethanopterin S-methyltransferase subunit G
MEEKEKRQVKVYLKPAEYERLNAIAARAAQRFGRKAGRGNGWNSSVIEALLLPVNDDELIERLAAMHQAA